MWLVLTTGFLGGMEQRTLRRAEDAEVRKSRVRPDLDAVLYGILHHAARLLKARELVFSVWKAFEVERKIPVFMEKHHSPWEADISELVTDDDEVHIA